MRMESSAVTFYCVGDWSCLDRVTPLSTLCSGSSKCTRAILNESRLDSDSDLHLLGTNNGIPSETSKSRTRTYFSFIVYILGNLK
jgi:hypothetical protein